MTRPPHLRSGLISATLVVLAVAAWLLVAPTQIGGETSYVTTSGISMSPRFHSGDLAVVRPAEDYRVGDIVAYHSTMLHIVVLHRIIAIKGDRYVFKGDNNDFVDPDAPRRAQTWSASSSLRVAARRPRPRTGCTPRSWPRCSSGGMALLLLHGRQAAPPPPRPPPAAPRRGVRQSSRCAPARPPTGSRRRRRRPSSPPARWSPSSSSRFGALAFTRPATKPSRYKTPYTEKVSFGYHAKALGRAGLPRRRREHGRPDLPQARAPRPRQGSLPPGGHGPASARRHDGGRPAPHRARPAGAAPSSSPLPSASPATTPPPT